MSSNGVMLQDYVPNAINNLTEEIWCAGAVIPAGKRVVLGHIRDGWQEITFTMGKTQDFIGMALVPPSVVGIEPAPYSYGMGMAPRSVSSARQRAGVGDQESPADLPEGLPESAFGMGASTMATAFTRAARAARAARRAPAIDQNAPLPSSSPGQAQQSVAPSHLGQVYVTGLLQWQGGSLFTGEIDVGGVSRTVAKGEVWNPTSTGLNLIGIQGWFSQSGDHLSGTALVKIGQHTNLGNMQVNLDLVPQSASPQPGQYAFSETARRARMEQASPANQSSITGGRHSSFQPPSIGVRGVLGTGQHMAVPARGGMHMGPVWPVGVPSHLPGIVRGQMRGARFQGFGAAGASEFTMKAAEELDDHLTTNGCAGCDDYKSMLRQLAFKFKAACMTDPGVSGQVSFNISTPLAMTAFGTGTDKALTLVLGAKKTYSGGPCTDDNGACLGNLPQISQMTPVALGPLVTQVINTVGDQLQQHQASPVATQLGRQEQLVNAFMAAVTGLLTALSAAIANTNTKLAPSQPQTSSEKKIPWGTVVMGGLIGSAVLGTGVLLYTQARKHA